MTGLFGRVLIANRGEIAERVLRTLRLLQIESVAVFSDPDAGARHVREADDSRWIGPAPAVDSYLSIDRIIAAATDSGADAIHPGYGFLSENPRFAQACSDAGLVFIGPPAAAIAMMGDKVRAKATVGAAGVPVVPGSVGHGLDDGALATAASEVGYPVLLKPSAGGGGKGMRVVAGPEDLADAIASARREALHAFGDDTLLVERFVVAPRHIEVQVLADHHGHVVHLGERECSLQRRHQKIIEEAPSVLLDPTRRESMGAAAVLAARSCGYTNAGTVEFIVSATSPDEFFFMEMNTRLQVEHPVTELVYGIDLVEMQLRMAAGEPLVLQQSDLVPEGHAVEARIYAEDPAKDFLPTGGKVVSVREPAGRHGVRVDSSIEAGLVVGSDYDPMLAKVIAHGDDRSEALSRLDAALAETLVFGFATNVSFVRSLLSHADVRSGSIDTGLVERSFDDLIAAAPVPDAVTVAAALLHLRSDAPARSPWERRDGWAPGGHRPVAVAVDVTDHHKIGVSCSTTPDGWRVRVDDRDAFSATLDVVTASTVTVSIDGRPIELPTADDDGSRWFGLDGSTWLTRIPRALGIDEHAGRVR